MTEMSSPRETQVEEKEEQDISPSDTSIDVSPASPVMRRELGLLGAVSLIVGGIIGSGIFVSPAGVLEATGSVGLSLVVWVGAGLIALMGSLCYSELGTLIPKSGGDYSYVREAFGDLVAFLWVWVSIMLIRPSSLAVMSLTFGTYFAAVFDLCGRPELFARLAAVACLVTVMLLNCYSTKWTNWATVISTTFKVAALLVIVAGGILKLAQGNTSVLATGFQGSTTDPTTISLALYDALWAYDGWVNLNTVAEELQNPSKNLPRANIGGVVLVILVYVATNVAYFTAMTSTEMLEADAVAVVCLAIVFVFLGNISSLVDFFSFTAWFFYGMSFAALLVFRYTKRHTHRPYKCPIIFPILMLVISVYLVIAPIVKDPAIGFLYAAIFSLAGALLYFPFVKYKLKLPFTDQLTTFTQLVLEVVPASKFID
ncbi:Y+l amino acid transporter 1 [Plakobranchus ocellatus]|uniref:Y+l amino acid transporter 1 n=1 Tax=Plakobranchus ocellatus TaxID=259542 RepID=A0AAV3ZCT3_9GAST|nr:Y+l amino acid transporter 1 [Plakobranchus ocellatus]